MSEPLFALIAVPYPGNAPKIEALPAAVSFNSKGSSIAAITAPQIGSDLCRTGRAAGAVNPLQMTRFGHSFRRRVANVEATTLGLAERFGSPSPALLERRLDRHEGKMRCRFSPSHRPPTC
jgi:hypothetical protein